MKALCLPGGGAHGILQLGMLAAYLDSQQTYDSLYCTSVGALNGFMLHSNQFPELINIWKNMNNNHIYQWNLFKIFGTAASLASSSPLEQLIKSYLNYTALARTDKKCFISVTNLSTMKAETKQVPCDNTAQWILTSASAPLAFPIQTINGKQYSDGGMTRDFSIEQAIKDGHTEIVVLCPSALSSKPIRNLIDMLEAQLAVQAASQYQDEVEMARILNKSQNVISLTVYRPNSVPFGQLDFNYAGKNFDKLYKLGYDMLSKPAVQFRRTLIANKPTWMVYH